MAEVLDITSNRSHLVKVIKSLQKQLLKIHKNKQDVLYDEDELKRAKILVEVSLCKIPEVPENGKTHPVTIQCKLPFGFIDKVHEVLFICRDFEKTSKSYDKSLHYIKDIIKNEGLSDLISEVMTIRQLVKEYKETEAKNYLAQRFDFVLCDASVFERLPKYLGKSFYGYNKKPIKVDMRTKNVRQSFQTALSKFVMNLSLNGPTAAGQFGRMNQSANQLTSNLVAVIKTLKKRVPGGEANIRSLHVRTHGLPSIPIYHTTALTSTIPNVAHPYVEKEFEVAGENSMAFEENKMVYIKGNEVVAMRTNDKPAEVFKLMKEVKNASQRHFNPKLNKIRKPKAKVIINAKRKYTKFMANLKKQQKQRKRSAEV